MTWHTGILAALGLRYERGQDPETARIAAACVMRVDGSGQHHPIAITWPDNAPLEEVIGETTAQLLRAIRAGNPIVGYDVAKALTVLDRECRRHNLPTLGELAPGGTIGPVVCGRVLDAHVTRRPASSPATLVACCEAWDVRLKDPDDPAWCAWAAAGVAVRIAQRHRAIGQLGLDELHARQAEWKLEQDAGYAGWLRRQVADARTGDDQLDLHDEANRVEAAAGCWPVVPFERQEQLG